MLNIVEFTVLLAILLLILVEIGLSLLRGYQMSQAIEVVEESLNRKGALSEIGKGFWLGFNNSIAGSSKLKMQQNAFLVRLTEQLLPEQAISWLPTQIRDEIKSNPYLIPTLLRFIHAFKKAGVNGLTQEFTDVVGESGENLSGLGNLFTSFLNKTILKNKEKNEEP